MAEKICCFCRKGVKARGSIRLYADDEEVFRAFVCDSCLLRHYSIRFVYSGKEEQYKIIDFRVKGV